MNVESILNYVIPFVSDFNFIISMLIIVMIAACFLGRYVVITRKMIIVTLGVVV